MRDLRERLIMDDDNEEIQRQLFFRLLTGGKKENQYRVMLLPFFFTIAIGMISIPIIVILYRWVDLNITYLQDMEALIMASITLIVAVFIAQLAYVLILQTSLQRKKVVDHITKANFKKLVRTVGIFVIFSLILALITSVYPMLYGIGNYRTYERIYGTFVNERAETITENMTGEMKLVGIHEIRGNLTFRDLRIFSDNEEGYGLIMEKGSSLHLINCTMDGTNGTGLIFEMGGELKARNTTFKTVLTKGGPSMTPGMILFGYRTRAFFKNCTFVDCANDAIVIASKSASFENCTFKRIGEDAVSVFHSNATFRGCSFESSNRAVRIVNAIVNVQDCTFSDCDMGIYTENSLTSIDNCSFIGIDRYAVKFFDDRPVLYNVEFTDCNVEVVEHRFIGTQVFCFLISPMGAIMAASILIMAQIISDRLVTKKLGSLKIDDNILDMKREYLFPNIVRPQEKELLRSSSNFLYLMILLGIGMSAGFIIVNTTSGTILIVAALLTFLQFSIMILILVTTLIDGNSNLWKYFSFNGDGLFFYWRKKDLDRFYYIPWKNVIQVKEKRIPIGILIKSDKAYENQGKGILPTMSKGCLIKLKKKDRDRFLSVYRSMNR